MIECDVCRGAGLHEMSKEGLTCFRASFFPFCPLSWPPLFLPFGIFSPFCSPSKSALFCRAKGTAQSLERGSSGKDLSTDFEKEIPSRNLREKRSEEEDPLNLVHPLNISAAPLSTTIEPLLQQGVQL